MLILRELTEKDEAAFMRGMREWEGEDLSWYTFLWREGMKFSEMLSELKNSKEGIGLPPNWVPSTMFYSFLDGEIIGRVNVRHQINENLMRRGGHLGYAVAPKFRGRGYGLATVRMVLPKVKALGIDRALVTCGDENEASWKIIERVGGKLAEKVWDETDGETVRKYWVELEG